MTGPDQPPDLAQQLTALAAQYERLERAMQRADRRANDHQAAQRAAADRLAQAEQDTTTLRAALDQAHAHMKDLTDQVRAMRGRPSPPALSWLDAAVGPPGGPPGVTPQQILADLAAWLETVYVRLPGAPLPACWAYHPGVVEILLTLRMAHAEVYSARGSWEKALAWHLRSRPDAAKTISQATGMCEIRLHAVGGPLYQGRGPEVPLAGFLDEIAAVWAARRETPDPTAMVIAACDRYVHRVRDAAA